MSFSIRDTDVIDLDISDVSDINLTQSPAGSAAGPPAGPPATTSGGGLELLMNDRKAKSSKSSGGLGELDALEKELNDLSDSIDPSGIGESKATTRSSLFDVDAPVKKVDAGDGFGVSFDDGNRDGNRDAPPTINLGKASSELDGRGRTWDGYGKFNDIPVNPDMDESVSTKPKMSPEELLKEKFGYLRKLEALEQKGVALTKKYSMESDLAEMQGEYEMIISEKERSNSVKFQGKMLMAAITGIEFLNNKIDPFDINLDGWGEQVNENIDDYDEIFSELHNKYKSKATMAPEMKLLMALVGSGVMVHMTNSMFKTAVPGMDDIMRQNPDLMKQFSQAAVNSMGATNPGLSGFMNDVSNQSASPPRQQQPPPPRQQQPPPRQPTTAPPPNFGQGVSMSDAYGRVDTPPKRVDMKGPSDISSILSNIKKKQDATPPRNVSMNEQVEVGSSISIQELTEMNRDMGGTKGKRRPRSERNTISIDL
jgi:hypothetical protein